MLPRFLPCLFPALLFVGSWTAAAHAADNTSAKPASPLPFNVEAQQSLEYQQNEHVYIARGAAKVTRGELSVSGDTLTAYERDKAGEKPADKKEADSALPGTSGGSTEIWKFTADGNVVISNGKATAYGDHATYDIDTQLAILTGRDLRLLSDADILTARDRFEYYGVERKAIAIGDAKAVRRLPTGTRTVYADRMTAYFTESTPKGAAKDKSKDKGKNLSADRIDAVGHVRVVSENGSGPKATTDIVTGDRGTYNLSAGKAVLNGHVRITRGPNQLEGDAAEVDFNTGVSKLLSSGNGPATGAKPSRVRGLLLPGAGGFKAETSHD